MSNIPNLASLARLRLWSWGWSTVRRKAFWFDWTNDYISSNATIGRTGYDMNVSGNVTTGSDGDGSYFWINWNRNWTASTGTRAEALWGATPTFTQATDFTIKARVKLISNAVSDTTWIFWSRFAFCISNIAGNSIRFTVRWSSTIDVNYASSLNTLYDLHLVRVAADAKFYYYVNSVLQNVWWTAWPATFTTAASTWLVWDNAIGWGNPSSWEKYIYHACIRNKALTQAEIDADIALWNTTKQDPSIVAYYVPENLQYNTQYANNPKDLTAATRAKDAGVTVTANTTVAPDGTTTADTVAISWAAWTWFREVDNTITGATLASKTFIVKAFVKVPAATASFRLECTHWWVTAYRSSDLTATTTRQEFTFTQTFTSSTSWTSINFWLCNSTTWAVISVEVRNVRLFLGNETLRDESPNMWGYLWRKQNEVISTRIKPSADAVWSTGDTQCFSLTPYLYWQLRTTSNNIQIRADTRLAAIWAAYTLWNGFRDKAHILWVRTRDWTKFLNKLYLNWVLVGTANWTEQAPISSWNYWNNFWMWRRWTSYFSWNIRDARIYTFTWSFTDADALAIYNWWEPTSAWVTKYLHYRPPVGEVWTTTQDQSPNDRDWTLNGGVTRDYI